MKNSGDASESAQEKGYVLSYKLAWEQIAKISDIEEQCHKTGARYVAPNEIAIDYLGQWYRVRFPEMAIALENSQAEIPIKDKILILHYFTKAKGTPPTGILVSYKQLPGGISYFPAFSQRAIAPLVKHLGQKPELLKTAAAKLQGQEMDFGDASVIIRAFSHVPVILVLWRGDEEVSSSANILFDANISDYLSTEDVTVLCETIVWRLVRNIPAG